MPRRSATLAVSILLLVALAITASQLPVPYAALSPGPTTDTLGTSDGKPLIEIRGERTYPTKGHLNLTTVAITNADYRMDLIRALRGWIDPEVAVVPRETFYPDDKSEKEIRQENVEDMQNSQQHATTAALRQLRVKVTSELVVGAVVKDSASDGKLHAGDLIRSVDGTPVRTPQEVQTAVRKHKPGDVVTFQVERKGKPARVAVTAREDPEQKGRPLVGIATQERHRYPFEVKIQLDNVAGPSAGLMFALGIVDKLNPEDITGGQFIAGTGEIDDEGKVGPIGGIQMKIIAARKAGAKVFLTPRENCAEAAAVDHDGMRLVKVETLKGALDALTAVRTGKGQIPAC
jgi:PDZ domain-containing protein